MDAYAITRSFAGHAEVARGLIEEARRLAERPGDAGLQVAVNQRMLYIEVLLGNLSAARASAEKGIALAEGDVKLGGHLLGFSPALLRMVVRTSLLARFGEHEPWLCAYERAERLALEHDEIEIVAHVAYFRCGTRILYVHPAGARHDGARGAEIAEQLGGPFWISFTAMNQSWACAEAGAFADALATAERGLADARGKNAWFEIILLARLAEARCRRTRERDMRYRTSFR